MSKPVLWSLFGILLASRIDELHAFDSLTQAAIYAQQHDEYPTPDNQNLLYPDYTSYHKRFVPGLWGRFLNRLGIRKDIWSAPFFKSLLLKLVDKRKQQGMGGRFVQKIMPQEGSKLIIWGDLHGAFHSLVRGLLFLKEQGVIDDHFYIVSKQHYFIFNGNAINQSAYTLETLTLIMQLMLANPYNVFYIEGDHEDKNKWLNYGLARELRARCLYVDKARVPLEKEVARFFDTLPYGLYVQSYRHPYKSVRISYYGYDTGEIDEEEIAPLLIKKNEQPVEIIRFDTGKHTLKSLSDGQHNIKSEESRKVADSVDSPQARAHKPPISENNMEKPEQKLTIKAIIQGEDRTTAYKKTEGLVSLEIQQNTTAWSVLSSPTSTYQKEFSFFYDAYAQILVQGPMSDWIIELYNRDVRLTKPFQKRESRKLVAQDAVTDPANTTQIRLGSTIGISRGLGSIGRQIAAGLQLRMEQARDNKTGVRTRLFIRDDEYDPSLTRKFVEDFIKDGIDLLLMPTGSPTLESYYDLIKAGKVLVMLPSTGVAQAHSADFKYMFHYRGDDRFEGRVLAEYLLKELKVRKVMLVVQEDAFGLVLLEGVKKVLQEHKINHWSEVRHARNAVDFSKQIKIIDDNNPDALVFLGITTAAMALIRQMGVSKLVGKYLLGNSDFNGDSFAQFIKETGLPFTTLSVVPNPETSDVPIVENFRTIAQQKGVALDAFALEGYIAADIALYFLNQVKGPITKEAILAAVESAQHIEHLGLTFNFDPTTRELGRPLWINTGGDKYKKVVIENGVVLFK